MASVLVATRMAQELFGINACVRLEEGRVDDAGKVHGLPTFPPSLPTHVRAAAIKHPQGNPHKVLDRVDGDWIPCIDAVSQNDHNRGRTPRGLVEDMALDSLVAKFAERKAAAELERARALVAANPLPSPSPSPAAAHVPEASEDE